MTGFDDFFSDDDFIIDPQDVTGDLPERSGEGWDTGMDSDIFATGEMPDIFSTKIQ